jgi:hypothetical protein
MSTNRRRCQGVLCLLSLFALAGCFAKPMKLKTTDAASEARQSDGGGAGGEAAPGDGPGLAVDSNMMPDGFSSGGGSSGSGGIGGNGGASTLDASANGGNSTGGISSGGSTGGGMGGSSGTGFDAAFDLAHDAPAVDAPGTCSADRDCPSQAPLCLGNRCAKCAADSDCAGRAGPACAASGLCVACTANKYCTGTAATCDLATNQCVGCVTRSDCAGACQSCTSGVCAAVKGKDDPGFCAGTCDASGACKKKQGQACQTPADCASGIACADGYCCDKACRGSCEACDVPSSLGTCTTLAANATPRADRTACAGSSPCKGSCNGTSASCTYPGVETTCVQASCTGQTATLAASCAGDGTCTTATTKPCNGSGCNGTVCSTGASKGGTCSTTAQCAAGLYCTDGVCCATQSSCGTCKACNVPGSLGTCSSVAAGTTDPACPNDSTNCMAGGCNSSGSCQASALGTSCGSVCTDDASLTTAGQRSTASSYYQKKCNGTAGSAGCVKDASTQSWCIPGSARLTCASSTTCKTQCYTDSDCVWGYYCDSSTAMCTPRKSTGDYQNSCSRAMECFNGACISTYDNPAFHCGDCQTGTEYTCELATLGVPPQMVCQGGFHEPSCLPYAPDQGGCNSGGSGFCPPNAPNCGSNGLCVCGTTGGPCSEVGDICVNGQCKRAGGFPCINSSGCAYGTCNAGVCPPTPTGGVCTQLLVPNECANGNCSASTPTCP